MPKVDCSPVATRIDPLRCMGKWYVQQQIPAVSFIEKGAHNGCEEYTYDETKKRVKVSYTFNKGSLSGPLKQVFQRGWVKSELGTTWAVKPYIALGLHAPFKLPYHIIDIDRRGYSYMTAAAPVLGSHWLYLMTREAHPPAETVEAMLAEVKRRNFDMKQLQVVPHDP